MKQSRTAGRDQELHPLKEIFDAALEQVCEGKGFERHGKEYDGQEFRAQPWKQIATHHGRGFLTGQAAKKLQEAAAFGGQPFKREMLGVIVYAAMAIIHEEDLNTEE